MPDSGIRKGLQGGARTGFKGQLRLLAEPIGEFPEAQSAICNAPLRIELGQRDCQVGTPRDLGVGKRWRLLNQVVHDHQIQVDRTWSKLVFGTNPAESLFDGPQLRSQLRR